MALPSRYSIEKKINSMEGLSAYENGGKGSGNFGHAGRPGEKGGSAPSGSSHSTVSKDKRQQEYEAVIAEEATLRGTGAHRRIEDIARQFDKDPGEVEQDLDDYGVEMEQGVRLAKTEMKTRIKKSIDSWVKGPQDEHSSSEAQKILKEADDYIRSIGKDPKESKKVWDELSKKEKDADGELKVDSEDALLALVGEAKHHLSNPDKTFSKGKTVPYYRKAYDSLRKLSYYLGGENRVSVGSDINGPFTITREPN